MKNKMIHLNILFILTFLLTMTSHAVNKNSSWSDILKQGDLYIDFPVIHFLAGTIQVSIKDVCLDGDHVRRINSRYEKCFDQNDEVTSHGPCVRKEVYTLSAPRVQVKDVCMEFNYQDGICAKNKTVRSVLNVEEEVSVYRRNNEDLRAELLFKKSYKLSECR